MRDSRERTGTMLIAMMAVDRSDTSNIRGIGIDRLITQGRIRDWGVLMIGLLLVVVGVVD
jgi:hypothetical protein